MITLVIKIHHRGNMNVYKTAIQPIVLEIVQSGPNDGLTKG